MARSIAPAMMAFAAADPERNACVSANIPMGGGGRPEEVAQAICFLLSEESSYTTGTCTLVAAGKLRQLHVPA